MATDSKGKPTHKVNKSYYAALATYANQSVPYNKIKGHRALLADATETCYMGRKPMFRMSCGTNLSFFTQE